ncbi:cytochrome d ubiquinol oxidase subunit II [Acetobacteraceae bacterium KSS8]|uniref:Cytochrome d ubiquinol oxidase subunit II n=1 Tax=Endosaccharibacter trunci TaxID=2812733 RepID=A0ABT1W9R2_9PROT|nr:cytochrome d ubiquinol oxidase subunit II [Acetobacteraceae bacterium KSS8]
MHSLFDYPTLRVIWWALLGVLLIGFALADGWDLGVCALLPFLGRTDQERRMMINSVGPTWEGNQVWFILGGGAIFAAWPFVYAASFSGFYLAMFVVLAALIMRPVGFKYRSKKPEASWRARWDGALFVGGLVPALVFGVAVGNVLQGVPIRLDDDLRVSFEGSFLGLFTPTTLLCGLLSVSMMLLHGSSFLAIRLEHGALHERARRVGMATAILSVLLFAAGGLDMAFGGIGFRLSGAVDPAGPSNPLRADTVAEAGGWLLNFAAHPWMMIAPALGFGGAVLALFGLSRRSDVLPLAGSALSSAGIIATVGLSMFPFVMPSSVDAHSSLLVWNASSSARTLFNMLISTVILLPLVLLYTAWVYRVLWGRVTGAEVIANRDFY